MPYSYTKHFNDYRQERIKNTEAKRSRDNLPTTFKSPLTGKLIEVEYDKPICGRWTGDPLDIHRSMFNYWTAVHTALVEIYKKELTKLRKKIRHEANGNIKKYMSHLGFRSHRISFNDPYNKPLFRTLIQARYDTANSDADDILKSMKLGTVRNYDTSWDCERRSAQYLKDYHTEHYADMISSIQDKLECVDTIRRDYNQFLAAFRREDGDFLKSIDQLSEYNNPYLDIRKRIHEDKVVFIKRQEEITSLLTVSSDWLIKNTEESFNKQQDELDRKYRQRVERKKELKARLSEKREAKRQLERKQLIAEVKVEMLQWKDDIHSGKTTCGCTSSPNAEGIRALKKHYSTLEDATEGARSALFKGLHLRPYKCPVKKSGRDGRHYTCGGYHLTKFEG